MATAAAATGTEDDFAQQSREYEQRIAEQLAIDPGYPQLLVEQFEYAKFLARQQEHCSARLDKAEELRQQIEHNAAAAFVVPDAAARFAQLRYVIASGRADCTRNKAQQQQWHEQARTEALQAVELYRAQHDYINAAVMQYNVAQQDRRAGNSERARAELLVALEMDERYGLRDDAEENLRYLGKWSGEPTSDVQVAELMNRYADRTVVPAFHWNPGESAGTFEMTRTHFAAAAPDRVTLRGRFRETVSAESDGLVDDTALLDIQFDSAAGDKVPDADAKMTVALTKIMGRLPGMRLSRTGEFRGLQHAREYLDNTAATLRELPGQLLGADGPKREAAERRLEQWVRTLGDESALTERMRDDYELYTGMWSDTALTRGEWRQGTALLEMPGAEQWRLEHNLSYEFAAWVPCTEGDGEARCVELLVLADPADGAVKILRDRMAKAGKRNVAYWSTTHLRLVVDPRTLRPQVQERRQYASIAYDNGKQHEVMTTTKTTVFTVTSSGGGQP
jgi:hypothetical protein